MSPLRSLFAAALIAAPLFAAGCAAPMDDIGEEEGASDNALTAGVSEGTTLTTTANLNLRASPSTSAHILDVMPKGTVVTALGDLKSGFLHVSADGEEGWAYSTYLRTSNGSTASTPSGSAKATLPSNDAGASSGAEGVGEIQSCKASFYDTGSQTANGEHFDPNGMTAAHKTLPFNTRIRVTNTANNKSVVVRINDRGPFVAGRCLDLARGAFTQIASTSAGTASISFQVVK